MCGLLVIVHPDSEYREELMQKLLPFLYRRGPDDHKYLHVKDRPVTFGHTRLAIKGGAASNNQPLYSNYSYLSYNGEIYNSVELARETGFSGNPTADGELLQHGLEKEGTEFIKKINGMWAFAWFDSRSDILCLSRDRYGIKPLYAGVVNGCFMVASELKIFSLASEKKLETSSKARDIYFRYGYIPAPYSIYENVINIQHGTTVSFTLQNLIRNSFSEYEMVPYYSPPACRQLSDVPFERAVANFEELLHLSLSIRKERSLSHVNFLSGGIDSTLLLAMQARNSDSKLNVLTAGFQDPDYDESKRATTIADSLGVAADVVMISPGAILENLDELFSTLDAPLADSSLLPCLLLSKKASDEYKIAFSGDGADELFYGYDRYRYVSQLSTIRSRLPYFLRSFCSMTGKKTPDYLLARLFSVVSALMPNIKSMRNREHHLRRALAVCGSSSLETAYEHAVAYWSVCPFSGRSLDDVNLVEGKGSIEATMQHFDFDFYLADNLLVKMDRSSMIYGLEVRVPYLDYRCVDYVFSQPFSYIYDDAGGKRLLKALLKKYVPNYDFSAPKRGFGVPLSDWLRGPLRELAESKLQVILQELGPDARKIRDDFFAGKDNRAHLIWSLVVYQIWNERYCSDVSQTGSKL